MPALGEVFSKINPWHKDNPPPPRLTTRTTVLLLILYALSYFIPFYLSSSTRPSTTHSRDAPSVIRARIRSVTFTCFTCAAATYIILLRTYVPSSEDGDGAVLSGPHRQALHLLGVWPVGLWDGLKALGLTMVLYLGPLYAYLVVEGGWRDWILRGCAPAREVLFGWEWTSWRNIVAGPITEELLFRSSSIPLTLRSPLTPSQIIFFTPIIFGLSHVHHFYEFRLSHPGVSFLPALLRSLFQFAYTTLFGAYATFLFLRTGSFLGVCAVHAFCNCMGLPQLWGRVEPEDDDEEGLERAVPVMAGGDAGQQHSSGNRGQKRKRLSILWTIIYYVLLVTGAVLWWRNLWSWTEGSNALVPKQAFKKAAL